MVKGSMKIVQYILGLVNMIFMCFGTSLVALGVNEKKPFFEFDAFKPTSEHVSTAMIVVGIILFVIAFIGCYGSFAESQCMLLTYGIIITLLLAIQVSIITLIVYYKISITTYLKELLVSNDAAQDPNVKDFEHLQRNLRCCGIDAPENWKGNSTKVKYLPESCCYDTEGEDTIATEHCENHKFTVKEGCFSKIENCVQKHLVPIVAGVAVVCLLHLIFITFSYCLSCSIRTNYDAI